jgi:hypothetical protein
VSPVKYELGFYIPKDGILHNHRRENLRSYTEAVSFLLTQQNDTWRGTQEDSGSQSQTEAANYRYNVQGYDTRRQTNRVTRH